MRTIWEQVYKAVLEGRPLPLMAHQDDVMEALAEVFVDAEVGWINLANLRVRMPEIARICACFGIYEWYEKLNTLLAT